MSNRIEPKLNYSVQDRYLRSLPSPFPPLTEQEKMQDWGKEMQIGQGFASRLELYEAVTSFKRAEILIPKENKSRYLEIQYEILLCYFFGQKWQDVIYTFENTALKHADTSFPALHDLLLILYDTYLHEDNEAQAQHIFMLIQHYFPEDAQKLYLSSALLQGDLPAIEHMEKNPPPKTYLQQFLNQYETGKKSVGRAQWLNAALPGAGYLYLGQRQSAITAFLLNGLFITASTYFFIDGNIAAGVIFTSFEAGWYFGGIYGAGLEAKYYNEHLYGQLATPMMNREGLFPVLMLKYAF